MTPRSVGERALSMPRSAIREFMSLASARSGTIRLEVGEPDFVTPDHIIQAALVAARKGYTKYTPSSGLTTLRTQIAQRVSKRTNTEVDPQRVVVTTGAVGGLFSVVMAITDPGDEVLVPDPGWPNYYSIVHLAGGRAVGFPLHSSNGFVPDPWDISSKITARTKAILINTPCNPVGTVFPRDVLQEIGVIADKAGLYLISDEVYEDFVFEGEHTSLLGLAPEDQTFLVSGFSKTYAMTGWRIGYVVCPESLAQLITGLQEPITSCASAISQKAAEAALTGPQDCVEEFRRTFRRRRDIVLEILEGPGLLAVKPAGAFYALVDIRGKASDSLQFAKDLLISGGVSVVPGITFGPLCEGYVRVAFTIGETELRMGLNRLRDHILRE